MNRFSHLLHPLQQVNADLIRIDVNVLADDLAAAAVVCRRLFEHAGANRRHLRTMVRAGDRGHQVSAESGTCGGQKSVFINIQTGAVRGEAGVQRAGYPGSHVAAVVRRSVEDDKRSMFPDQRLHGIGLCVGVVGVVFIALHQQYLVRAVGDGLLCDRLCILAQNHGDQPGSQLIRHGAARTQQLIANVLCDTVFSLYINPKIFIFHGMLPPNLRVVRRRTTALSVSLPLLFHPDSRSSCHSFRGEACRS